MEALHHHDRFHFNNHKKSGQIPAFGNWDYANELPITQYFDCARQAGLIRYSSSSGDTVDHPYVPRGDFHAVDHHHYTKPHRAVQQVPARKTKRCPPNKEQKKQLQGNNYSNNNNDNSTYKNKNKVCDVTEQPRKLVRNDAVHRADQTAHVHRAPKPVDEDLYKIPPELLHYSKRKKRLGIFSRCLVPACTS